MEFEIHHIDRLIDAIRDIACAIREAKELSCDDKEVLDNLKVKVKSLASRLRTVAKAYQKLDAATDSKQSPPA